MNAILIAVLLLSVLGFLGALLLVVASKFLTVETDPRAGQLEEALPGANCGGCGYAGCSAYASAILEGAPVNQCSVGGAAVAAELAAIMGVDAGEAVITKAVVACQGSAHVKYEYVGIPSCRAANALFNGNMTCPYGCLGFGDCVAVCPQGAISIVGGTAYINSEKCVGCGLCEKTCPKGVIKLYHNSAQPLVKCANTKTGAAVRKECSTGCIGCRKCAKSCPAEAITVTDNLARIDPEKCIGCGTCVEQCPVHAICLPELSAALAR